MAEETKEKPTVGILAYGSLISDPGDEIENARTKIIHDVMTPFHIEFARSSKNRGRLADSRASHKRRRMCQRPSLRNGCF